MNPDHPTPPSGQALVPAAHALNLRILSDGLAGHDAQTLGIAEALGLEPDIRPIRPRKLFELIAPFGPIDWRDRENRPGSPIGPPWPDIALAAGRRALPYLNRLKLASKRRVFTVYVNRPATGRAVADLIVSPLHDAFFGPNVVTPITPANRVSPELLARLRREPDPRVASLSKPRAALLVGGDNRHFKFTPPVAMALQDAVRALSAAGFSVMATASRRTPPAIGDALRTALAEIRGWLWDGEGDNPYFSMLAAADLILVSADSVSMIGEAVATGAPVHIFAPSGGSPKIKLFLERLQSEGAVRPWNGTPENWSYDPINETAKVAAAIRRAYQVYKGELPPLPAWRPPSDELLEYDEEGDDGDENDLGRIPSPRSRGEG
ncbi:MAG: mitochondrial fission ELM1 family protein [Methylocystis sp.]